MESMKFANRFDEHFRDRFEDISCLDRTPPLKHFFLKYTIEPEQKQSVIGNVVLAKFRKTFHSKRVKLTRFECSY